MRQTLCVFLLFLQVAVAADGEWELKRDRNGIQVYTRTVEGSKHRAVKSSMTVSAGLGEIVALIRDADSCTEWAAFCRNSELMTEISETEMYVYTYNDIPWPAADRDAVTLVQWAQSDAGVVSMIATIEESDRPEVKRVVRLIEGTTSWSLKPLGEGMLKVESEAHINPRGRTPAWLTNRLLVDAPYDTLVGMRDLLDTGRYEGSRFDFITEQ